MKNGDNWQCPFCRHFQVLSEKNRRGTSGIIGSDLNKHGIRVGQISTVECMNAECRELIVRVDLGKAYTDGPHTYPSTLGRVVMPFVLRPSSMAKPQHASVPSPLVTDYEEACSILHSSPKASATLARRCLQGMIRDFCGINKNTLAAEIVELEKQVSAGSAPRQVSEESIDAIDAIRAIGNIGAHFEKDINIIIEVEPEEAEALIGLIELLFSEWYVARYERQERLQKVKAIAVGKAGAKAAYSKGQKAD